MSGDCREKIRPEIGLCMERAVNQFEYLDSEFRLSDKNCRVLWHLMCELRPLYEIESQQLIIDRLHFGCDRQ